MSYLPKTYKKDGGDTIVVASGGKIEIESGGEIELQSGAIADLVDKILNGGDIALADGKILVGDATGKAAAVTPSGDVTVTNAGVTAIAGTAKTMINALRTWLADGLFAIGTLTISGVAAEKFKTTTTAIYNIAGLVYSKVATDNLTFSAADTINTAAGAGTLWGIWLVQINAAGAVSTKPGAADMTYATEAAAIAALPAVDASNVQLGYITVQALEATDWVANTDNLTVGGGAGNCTARNFYNLPGAKTLPAALA